MFRKLAKSNVGLLLMMMLLLLIFDLNLFHVFGFIAGMSIEHGHGFNRSQCLNIEQASFSGFV